MLLVKIVCTFVCVFLRFVFIVLLILPMLVNNDSLLR